MLEVVVMIYAGKSTKYIVALFTNAIGFWSWREFNSIRQNEITINYGFVGDVKKVNTQLLETLLLNNIVPYFLRHTHDGSGQLLHNADTIACECLQSLYRKFWGNVTVFWKTRSLFDAEMMLQLLKT
jgi:acetylglutamate kinase